MQNTRKEIVEYKEQVERLEKEEEKLKELKTELEYKNKKLQEQLGEFGNIIEKSDATIEEYKTDNEDLRIKIWKAIRTIQSKDKKLEEKDVELEIAEEVIKELRERLLQYGDEQEESDEDD